jgi:murein DD-endopeptidase MepM/ murein hydrolase activator NlpD
VRGIFTLLLFFGGMISSKGQILLFFGNNSLALIEHTDSAAIASPESDEEIAERDTTILLFSWDNSRVHIDSVDLSGMTDTINLSLISKSNPHFFLPIEGEIVDNFHWRHTRHHNGLDIRLNTGDTVYAAFDGLVRYAQYNTGGYGNLVVLRHYNMLETYYGHFSKILVTPDTYVKAGTPIGLGGSTGRSTGPHLHFEVRYLGNALDPERIIDWQCGSLTCTEIDIHRDLFKHKFEKPKVSVSYHRVRSGETLSAIARKYNTSVTTICRLNGIRQSSVIRPGQSLRVK